MIALNNAGARRVTGPDLHPLTPGTGPNHASVPAPTATFSQTETPGVNYYYVVRGMNNVNAPSGNSNRTGKVVFGLTPGSATP